MDNQNVVYFEKHSREGIEAVTCIWKLTEFLFLHQIAHFTKIIGRLFLQLTLSNKLVLTFASKNVSHQLGCSRFHSSVTKRIATIRFESIVGKT